MREGIDLRVSSWIRGVLSEVDISLDPPTIDDDRPERGVSLYLWQLRPKPPLGAHRHDVLGVALQYLVSTWASDPSDAHEMLLDLAYAAMQEPGFEVDMEPLEPAAWLALGVPPAPSFRLTVPSHRVLPAREVRPVLHPLEVMAGSMSSLSGWVRTPDGMPIPGARVEVPAVDRGSRTDAEGRFRLHSIPAGQTTVRVRVDAKGHEVWATVGAADDRSALVIEMDPTEDSDARISHS